MTKIKDGLFSFGTLTTTETPLTLKLSKMAPSILVPEPTFTVTPMTKTPKEKHNFGALIKDLDLRSISGKLTVPRLPSKG